jgi:hypothetical protein
MSDAALTASEIAAAAAAYVAEKPGARILVYVDTGPETEPAVFASGTDEEAADLILAVGEWLDADDEDDGD